MNRLNLAISEGFLRDEDRRKRLGQYFTGLKLARLLCALAEGNQAQSVLDLMAGEGDMLLAALDISKKELTLGAVEIDPIAAASCRANVPLGTTIVGNAFDYTVLRELPSEQWDLVITNPPYVRYQSLKSTAGEQFPLPSSISVRRGLINAIDQNQSLDAEDKRLFGELARTYSGLADLAVPSWILSAVFCAPGGRIALVLPESWMSRSYASVVQYLLLRWFKLEFIIEDTSASWFENAQVKTNLLVAKRIERRPSAFDWVASEKFLKVRIHALAAGPNSLVQNICSLGAPGNWESQFAASMRNLLSNKVSESTSLFDAETASISGIADNLKRSISKNNKLKTLETLPFRNDLGESYSLPHALEVWLSTFNAHVKFTTLEPLRVGVGQGLRTGANDFFYVDALTISSTTTVVKTSVRTGSMSEELPNDCILPVLRKQTELPDRLDIDASSLLGRVLTLQSYALPEDLNRAGRLPRRIRMSEPLERVTRAAELADFSGKGIRELSAVAPNIRPGKMKGGGDERFWYMLPDLAPRHQPDIVIPRVNGRSPKAFINIGRKAVVDANFSTLWRDSDESPSALALVALLNSSWCTAALELSATVMGGGALKVEAAHLRRLPVPVMTDANWRRLDALGQRLLDGDALAKDCIDDFVTACVLGRSPTVKEALALRELAEDSCAQRLRQRKKTTPLSL
jgi:N-6 DNA Methylase